MSEKIRMEVNITPEEHVEFIQACGILEIKTKDVIGQVCKDLVVEVKKAIANGSIEGTLNFKSD